jgi:hypothetical protein
MGQRAHERATYGLAVHRVDGQLLYDENFELVNRVALFLLLASAVRQLR